MIRRAFIAGLLALCGLALGCQSDEMLERESAMDPESRLMMRHANEMMIESMRYSTKMAELEPPAPPEFYLAIGVYYHVNKRWPTDAAQLKEYGWTGNIPTTFTPQPNGGVEVVHGDQVKRTRTLFPPEARRTGLITREEAAAP